MKRLILTLAAAAALAASGPALAERGGHGDGGERHGGGPGGGEWRRGGDETRSGEWNRGGEWRRDGEWNRGREGRFQGPPGPQGWGGHWDDRRYNGYWYNNRWFYGPPPQAYFGSPLYRPGYSSWRRGGYLPPYYNGWIVSDYWRFRLRRPPVGYHWVRIGDDYLLVSSRSGLIFDIIPGGY